MKRMTIAGMPDTDTSLIFTRGIFRPGLLLSLLVLALALFFAPRALAQSDGGWFVYIYDYNSRTIMRVDATGGATEYPLGLAEDEFLGGHEIAFTADGSLAAFCTVIYPSQQDANTQTTLYVRDIAAQTNTLQLDLGPSVGCRAGAFNADASQVAVGVVYREPFAESAGAQEGPAWRLSTFDTATGAELNTLTADDDIAAQIETFNDIPVMTVATDFDESGVLFYAQPWIGMDGPPEFPTYRWNPAAASLEAVPSRGLAISDYLAATGELAFGAFDESLPAGEPMGPVPIFNLAVVRDAGGTERPVYVSPDWLVLGTDFVNDGNALLLTLLEPFNPQSVEPSETSDIKLITVDRAGNVAEFGSYSSYVEALGVPGGFAVLWAEYNEAGVPVMHLDHFPAGGAMTPLWQSDPAGNAAVTWQLIWAPPVTPAGDLPPFAAADLP
jgi:hypothetical protein